MAPSIHGHIVTYGFHGAATLQISLADGDHGLVHALGLLEYGGCLACHLQFIDGLVDAVAGIQCHLDKGSQLWDGILHLAGDDMPPPAIMDGFPNGVTLGNVWQLAIGVLAAMVDCPHECHCVAASQ